MIKQRFSGVKKKQIFNVTAFIKRGSGLLQSIVIDSRSGVDFSFFSKLEEDPTLLGLGKGRLSELLTFFEKLEEEALKSGHRSTLFRPPCPYPANKVWKKRSRSCTPKLSTADAKQKVETRVLSADDAELCQTLERMAGDADLDQVGVDKE